MQINSRGLCISVNSLDFELRGSNSVAHPVSLVEGAIYKHLPAFLDLATSNGFINSLPTFLQPTW